MSVQAILFNKNFYTEKRAEAYLKKHKHPYTSVRTTKNFFRYRLRDPKDYSGFFTKKVSKNIIYIIGLKKKVAKVKIPSRIEGNFGYYKGHGDKEFKYIIGNKNSRTMAKRIAIANREHYKNKKKM